MITPNEVKKKAARRYYDFLRASLRDDAFFPLEIRFRKAKASDEYLALRDWVEALAAGSKMECGFGYTLILEERELRRYGRQSLPARILIETELDFLRLIGKGAEFKRWQTAVFHTRAQFPQLINWLATYPQRPLPYLNVWEELLTVCAYFVAHPRPHVYMRELPVPVHTKFIEEHATILRQLLDELLPPEAIKPEETQFERRFGLRYDEPQIRLRLLDTTLPHELRWPASDLSLTLSDCAQLAGMDGRVVLIVENKMTFLTLPPLENGVAIWGKGFQVSVLREVNWLTNCAIWYWGDLDAQGFAILSQLRGYWPQTRSFLMDEATFERYERFVVNGTPVKDMVLANLDEGETAVYQQLAAQNWRLEQERITQSDVGEALAHLQRAQISH